MEQSKSFIVSFVLSLSLSFFLLKLSYRYKFLDIPVGRKNHFFPVALGGGIAVYLSLAIYSIAYETGTLLLAVASLLVIMGFIDDVFDISPALKFLVQVFSASIWVYLRYPSILGSPFVDFFLSVFWIVSMVNAFNFVDGIDGLASGIGALTFLGLAFKGVEFAIPLIGACLGFFLLNYPPARIFLGDAGSYLLGFLAGVLSLDLLNGFDFKRGLGVFLLVAFPAIDLIWAVLRRWAQGKPITVGDDRHIHHFLRKGLGDRRALFLLLLLQGLSVGIGVFIYE